jgi:hypothetical protein
MVVLQHSDAPHIYSGVSTAYLHGEAEKCVKQENCYLGARRSISA